MSQSVNVPAVVYITRAGKKYYGIKEGTGAHSFTLELTWDESELTFPAGAGTAIYERISVPGGDPGFLNGHLWFYRFVKNTDPGPEGKPVRRVAVLGLQRRGEFGFFKTVDFLDFQDGAGSPALSGEIDFQLFASSAGNYRHESDVEAGTVTALA